MGGERTMDENRVRFYRGGKRGNHVFYPFFFWCFGKERITYELPHSRKILGLCQNNLPKILGHSWALLWQTKNLPFSGETHAFIRRFCGDSLKKTSVLPRGASDFCQLTDAGTSVGANYREANRARSQADFRNFRHICESECAETQYWLFVIIDAPAAFGNRQTRVWGMLTDSGDLHFG